jgi:hypothetical protein
MKNGVLSNFASAGLRELELARPFGRNKQIAVSLPMNWV